MMQDKAIRTFGKLSIGMIVGMIAACAGGDTPATTSEVEDDIANAYPLGSATGVAGSSATPTPGGGTGGSAPRPPSNGGSSGRGGSGTGGSASPGAGGSASTGEAGSSAAGSAASSGGSAAGACDGFDLLKTSCGSSSCHGSGSPYSDFAASLAAAKAYVNEEAKASCNGKGPLLDPANPAASILVQKLEGVATCGSRMPLTGDYFDDTEVDCVKQWISEL
jgi:hypothetical protein